MSIIFEKTVTLVAFALIGYILAKTKIVNNKHAKILSTLLVYVFLPCNVLLTYINNFNIPYIKKNYVILIASSVIIITIGIVANFASKLFTESRYEQGIFAYAMSCPNVGYMGYPMAAALLGEVGLMNAMVFGLPISLFYINSIGFCRMTRRPLTPKCLLNIAFVPIIIGAILGLANFQPPEIMTSILKSGSSCMGPVSMITAGIVVSEFNLKALVCNVHTYVISALRLVIIPIAVGLITSLFLDEYIVQVAVLIYAMPCGLNTIMFPKLVDGNCEIGASHALISNIAACITVPLVLSLFGI